MNHSIFRLLRLLQWISNTIPARQSANAHGHSFCLVLCCCAGYFFFILLLWSISIHRARTHTLLEQLVFLVLRIRWISIKWLHRKEWTECPYAPFETFLSCWPVCRPQHTYCHVLFELVCNSRLSRRVCECIWKFISNGHCIIASNVDCVNVCATAVSSRRNSRMYRVCIYIKINPKTPYAMCWK